MRMPVGLPSGPIWPRQRGPVGLDGVVEDLERLDHVIDLDGEREAHGIARRDGEARRPDEDRLAWAEQNEVGGGRVGAGDAAQVVQVDRRQVVEHPGVVGGGGAVVGDGNRHLRNVARIGVRDREDLRERQQRLLHLDGCLPDAHHNGDAELVHVADGGDGAGAAVPDDEAVLVGDLVVHAGDEGNVEVEAPVDPR
jgi:hypothetical protein